ARLERALALRNASAAIYYCELPSRLRGPGQLLDSDLVPDLTGLLNHFRLSKRVGNTDTWVQSLQRAAEDLLKTEGLEESLRRLTHVPVPLPQSVRSAVTALPDPEFRRLIMQLVGSSVSPLAGLHVLRLLGDAV